MGTRTKLATLVALAAVCYAVGMQIYSGKEQKQSTLTLMNVEALSKDGEHGGKPCYNVYNFDSDRPEVLQCGRPCRYMPLNLGWWPSTSTCEYL